MEIIIHRVNKIKELKKLNKKFGAEIDLRVYKGKIILNHDPYSNGDNFDDYLSEYDHGTLVLNIKETGIEEEVLKKVKKKGLKDYFILDAEIPFFFKSLKKKERALAVRLSFYEPIELSKKFYDKVDWLWVDTIKDFNIDYKNRVFLDKFKICLVSPEFWDKPKSLNVFINKFKKLNLSIRSIMISKKNAKYFLKK
jgi:hypothetical protein|tara:strand:+ start:827 stop:1414 length:588 start_codon:yes stop_codon:yes gene_type:complete